jgi:hypothetical protein
MEAARLPIGAGTVLLVGAVSLATFVAASDPALAVGRADSVQLLLALVWGVLAAVLVVRALAWALSWHSSGQPAQRGLRRTLLAWVVVLLLVVGTVVALHTGAPVRLRFALSRGSLEDASAAQSTGGAGLFDVTDVEPMPGVVLLQLGDGYGLARSARGVPASTAHLQYRELSGDWFLWDRT